VGVGFNSSRLRLEADLDDGMLLNVNHDIAGGLVYGTLNF